MREKLLITIWFFLMILIGSAGTYAMFNYPNEKDNKVISDKDYINTTKQDDHQNETYKQIKFTNNMLDSKSAIKLTDKELLVEVKNRKIFIEGKETNIENDFDEIYIVDLDQDKQMELISRSIEETIYPNKNVYHAYKYKDDKIEEILRISIPGTIDTLYIKGKEVKIEYAPFGTVPDTKKEEIYMLKG